MSGDPSILDIEKYSQPNVVILIEDGKYLLLMIFYTPTHPATGGTVYDIPANDELSHR